jgi:hypothetical protein
MQVPVQIPVPFELMIASEEGAAGFVDHGIRMYVTAFM